MSAMDWLKKRFKSTPVEDEPAREDGPLAPDVAHEEGLDMARETEDLKQDPESVPNRLEEPAPPTPEHIGPDDENPAPPA